VVDDSVFIFQLRGNGATASQQEKIDPKNALTPAPLLQQRQARQGQDACAEIENPFPCSKTPIVIKTVTRLIE
jgi:hypothetical protein